MYQHYISQEYTSCFREGMPTLAYTWSRKTDEAYSPPRILHRHIDTAELMLFTSGTAQYTVDEHRYTVRAGDLIAINAGVRHDEDARHAQETTVFGIGLQNLKLVGLRDGMLIPSDASPILSLGEAFPAARECLQLMHHLSSVGQKGNEETCQLLACGLVSLFVQAFSHANQENIISPPDKMLTTRIQDYIEAHYREDITLQSIGKALHISSYYMAHVFKESTGYSLMQYVIRLRIGKAQELLENTNYPITQIAGMVGYDNSSHFNTMFTKNIGMSPGKYRKAFTQTNTD